MIRGILLLFLIHLLSCNHTKIPLELSDAFSVSGDNKGELEKVIKYFSSHPQDSLKLKAAIYIIKNMDGFYYYKGKQLDEYMRYLELINRDSEQGEYIMESFASYYGPFSTSELQMCYDLQQVKSRDIIKNINMAFRVWREQPWGKDINFEQFCEYILPFRIADETPGYNREHIYKQFNPLLDSVRKVGGDALMACAVINKKLRKDGWLFTTRTGFLPHFSAQNLIVNRTGMCRDMSDAAVYVMRSVGIPVGIDIVQQWPYKGLDHIWNTVLNKDGKNVMFMGVDQDPGMEHKPGTKKGKVFRRTYSINPESLAMQKNKNDVVPSFFANPRLKDVTDEYANCFDVSIALLNRNIPNVNYNYAYLSVFDNTDWVPVHWTKIIKRQAIFSKMEGSIVYLPIYYNNGRVIPANYPFILKENGEVQLLKLDTCFLNTKMVLTHIFPITPDQFVVANLVGGRFQAANKSDFSDAEDLHKITNPMPFWNVVNINSGKKFRYLRYLSPPGLRCGIGELEFYASKTKLTGKLLGTKESYNDSLQSITKAIDNNIFTCFVSKFSTGTWVGLDLGKQYGIDVIKYSAPINEKKNREVTAGSTYELLYWKDGYWVSAGKAITITNKVIFKDIPSNTLYVLKNLSKKADQRIFTYENGSQVWW